ncbi:MAG: putative transposase [Colwellia sp.]|jgi:putative transposase
MLEYKSAHAGIVFEKVNEAYTTQTCSCCGSRQNSPKGRSSLQGFYCCPCSDSDRDINAAKNILAVGHDRLVALHKHNANFDLDVLVNNADAALYAAKES